MPNESCTEDYLKHLFFAASRMLVLNHGDVYFADFRPLVLAGKKASILSFRLAFRLRLLNVEMFHVGSLAPLSLNIMDFIRPGDDLCVVSVNI